MSSARCPPNFVGRVFYPIFRDVDVTMSQSTNLAREYRTKLMHDWCKDLLNPGWTMSWERRTTMVSKTALETHRSSRSGRNVMVWRSSRDSSSTRRLHSWLQRTPSSFSENRSYIQTTVASEARYPKVPSSSAKREYYYEAEETLSGVWSTEMMMKSLEVLRNRGAEKIGLITAQRRPTGCLEIIRWLWSRWEPTL